jgi:endonuclease-8
MPEGPSIVILREEIEVLALKGRKIKGVTGNAKIPIDRMKGKTVVDFRSWGKHFLICFSDFTVRIHFLLFGSYSINTRKPAAPRLSLEFSKAELNFYSCSVKLLEQPATALYDWSADIMSEEWDTPAAVKKLKRHPAMLCCDALLDQDIFAGSGNIIKNEVLFRLSIHPLSPVGSLPAALLKKMAGEVRTYAFEFLKWKKEYSLKQHWQAHTKKTCPRCGIPFVKEYLGLTRRRSFYCPNCQVLYP